MTKSDSKYGDNGIARMSQKLDWDKDLKKKKSYRYVGFPSLIGLYLQTSLENTITLNNGFTY